jgi:hypothetical protein
VGEVGTGKGGETGVSPENRTPGRAATLTK